HAPLYEIDTEEKVKGARAKPKKESIPQKKIETHEGQKPLATPATRKIAREMNIDLSSIQGSGKDGRITPEDLTTGHSSSDEEVPLIGISHLMAKKMAESKREIPHFSFFEQVDATRLVRLHDKFKEEGLKQGIKVTYLPFLIRALSLTLKAHPKVNSSFGKDKIIIHKPHHIGIAMASNEGLIVPVLKNVQEMSLEEVVRAFEPLKQRALKGELTPDEMRGATITLTNFGVLGHGGGRWATPIINNPEAAILGVNKIQKQPVVKNDELILQETLNLSWSFDHRIIDGDLAAKTSSTFASLVNNPAQLL
ncbi:MAG: dihydrolipoamide acetyltransferase family protein, partial [Candidatus Paceibacterota bacterium]